MNEIVQSTTWDSDPLLANKMELLLSLWSEVLGLLAQARGQQYAIFCYIVLTYETFHSDGLEVLSILPTLWISFYLVMREGWKSQNCSCNMKVHKIHSICTSSLSLIIITDFLKTLFIVSDAFIVDEGLLRTGSENWVHHEIQHLGLGDVLWHASGLSRHLEALSVALATSERWGCTPQKITEWPRGQSTAPRFADVLTSKTMLGGEDISIT